MTLVKSLHITLLLKVCLNLGHFHFLGLRRWGGPSFPPGAHPRFSGCGTRGTQPVLQPSNQAQCNVKDKLRFENFANIRIIFATSKYFGGNDKNSLILVKSSWNVLKNDVHCEKFEIFSSKSKKVFCFNPIPLGARISNEDNAHFSIVQYTWNWPYRHLWVYTESLQYSTSINEHEN
jgi:hypothetical protein